MLFFFIFITLGLEMSDTKVYEPYIRDLLRTPSPYREAVFLKSRTVDLVHVLSERGVQARHGPEEV